MNPGMIRGVATHGDPSARWFVRLLQYQSSLTKGVETSNTEPPIHARFTYRGDVTPQINLT